ncbi:histone-like nucleoid-structuring protein Lsr2 [Pseudonocardia sp. RS010]|uniref:histone-like nucleoid-structuring protein Lsr2 n=1 Tax=Pseudonocardia sp. RS010 TaxID=3385979 RepID=UPI0039A017ED
MRYKYRCLLNTVEEVPELRQTQVTLVDDLDGGQADETVVFQLDGRSYEIDLSAANGTRLRDSLAPYIAAARGAPSGRRAITPRAPGNDRAQTQAIRAWARSQGLKIADRGRIPDEIRIRHANRT